MYVFGSRRFDVPVFQNRNGFALQYAYLRDALSAPVYTRYFAYGFEQICRLSKKLLCAHERDDGRDVSRADNVFVVKVSGECPYDLDRVHW